MKEIRQNKFDEEKQNYDCAREINIAKFERYLGIYDELPNDEKILKAKQYFDLYKMHRGKESKSEMIFTDYYNIIAVMYLLDVYHNTNDRELLWHCAYLLETCITHCTADSCSKLLLIRIYSKLNAFTPCTQIYESLDIKYVQHDTLGYLLTEIMNSQGSFKTGGELCKIQQRYYKIQRKDITESLITCYRSGNFRMVIDFLEYRNCMDNSYQNWFTKIEGKIIECIYYDRLDAAELDAKSLNFDSVEDNRDFKVLVDLNSAGNRVDANAQKENFKSQLSWLEFRKLQLELFAAVRKSDYDSTGVDELLEKLKNFTLLENEHDWKNLAAPFSSRAQSSKEISYLKNILHAASYVDLIMTLQLDDIEVSVEEAEKSHLVVNLKEIADKICTSLKEFMGSRDWSLAESLEDAEEKYSLVSALPPVLQKVNCEVVESLSLVSEVFSSCVLIIESIKDKIKSIKTVMQRKRRKKKNLNNTNKVILDEFKNFTMRLHSLGEQINNKTTCLQKEAENCKKVQIEDELWMRITKQSFSSYESCFDLQFQINHLRSMRLNDLIKL